MEKATIIHLSDIHIGKIFGEAEKAERLFRRIAEREKGAKVVITGDITENGSEKEFKKARSMLNELSKTNPVLTVPGNHDYRFMGILRGFFQKFFTKSKKSADKNWIKFLGKTVGWKKNKENWLGPEQKPKDRDGLGIMNEDEDYVIIGIDSGHLDSARLTAEGLVSEGLSKDLKKLLESDELKGKSRIVILHHYPFHYGKKKRGWINKIKRDRMKLKEPKFLLNAIKNNCEILLFGHKHEYQFWDNNHINVPYIIASHKTTDTKKGNVMEYLKITINNPGKKNYSVEVQKVKC